MGGGARQPQVRLAELVAALWLGVDLGFGQPMEHVLRQCLIALRLADHAGLPLGHQHALRPAGDEPDAQEFTGQCQPGQGLRCR